MALDCAAGMLPAPKCRALPTGLHPDIEFLRLRLGKAVGGGLVYYITYFGFMQVGRVDFLRKCGILGLIFYSG